MSSPTRDRSTRVAYDRQHRFMDKMDMLARMKADTIEEFGTVWQLPRERQFNTLQEIQLYCDVLLGSAAYRARHPEGMPRVTVKAALSGRESEGVYAHRATMHRSVMELPISSQSQRSPFFRELWVLHELAHHGGAGTHGDKWLDEYAWLVGNQMGEMFGMYFRIHMSTDQT